MKRNQICRLFLSLLIGAAMCPAAQAEYPDRPIRLIVGFPPAGAVDTVARALAPEMAELLGQPVVIENRPGAGGNIAGTAVARATPDGYTLGFLSTAALATNVSLYSQMPYDPRVDFAPVGRVAQAPSILVTGRSSGFDSLATVVEKARANPGGVMVAHGGTGTAMHLSIELINMAAGIDLKPVPYKGAAPATADLIGGQVALGLVDLQSTMPHINAGTLRALAVTSDKRSALVPNIPTVAEAGIPNFHSANVWFAVVAPAGTPDPVIRKLSHVLLAVVARPAVVARFAAGGIEPWPSTPEELGQQIKAEVPRLKEIVERAKINVE